MVIDALLSRLLADNKKFFTVKLSPKTQQDSYFTLEPKDGKISITADSAISAANGLYHYLKKYCNWSLTYCGSSTNQTHFPLPETETVYIKQKYRVYYNYCTYGYSCAFWDFERWEKEIDFLALNGINMPLAPIGIETVWYNCLLKFGVPKEEALDAISGPCHFAWQLMGNIEGAFPVADESYLNKRLELGKKILARMKEYGMTPIQPGFSGAVPSVIRKFSKSAVHYKPSWCAFDKTCQIDPTDKLYFDFGSLYYNELNRLLGLTHFYGADPFHESSPVKRNAAYLRAVGNAMENLVLSADKHAVLVMQSWSIRKEIATAISKDRLLVLDLNGSICQKTNGFWGYDFVTGYLHNFGGRINLHGDIKLVSENSYAKLQTKYPNIKGCGLFMEGIGTNPLFYDLALSMMTKYEPVSLNDYLADYCRRRYQTNNENLINALHILHKTAYAKGSNGVESSSIICARPALHCKKSGPNAGFDLPYDNRKMYEAFCLMLNEDCQSDGYRFDIMDILRQILSNLARVYQKQATKEFQKKNNTRFHNKSVKFLNILLDVDRLLATRKEYNFDQWITDAQSCSENAEQAQKFTQEASALLTVWGPIDDSEIFDYAWREWAGLIKNFYYVRWEKFFAFLNDCLQHKRSYRGKSKMVYGREAFRGNKFYDKLADFELDFVSSQKFPIPPSGDTLAIAKELSEKYKNKILRY